MMLAALSASAALLALPVATTSSTVAPNCPAIDGVLEVGQTVVKDGSELLPDGFQLCDSAGMVAEMKDGKVASLTSPAPVAQANFQLMPSNPAPPAWVAPAGFAGGLVAIGGIVIGGVVLSYRIHPDPSVKWGQPGRMLALPPTASAPAPNYRLMLEQAYEASPESPAETGRDRYSRPSQETVETVSLRPRETVQTDEWGDPIEAEEDEQFDLSGWTLKRFKEELNPHGGDFEVSHLAQKELEEVAQKKLWDYVREYGTCNVRCAVWQIFGITHKSGASPAAQRYQTAAAWVRDQWQTNEYDLF